MLHSHGGRLGFVGVTVVIRSSLAPFDCISVNGGPRTMEADPSILCDVPGGPHARMKAVAAVMMAVFVVGVPTSFALILFLYRNEIRADQLLRERGEGDSALTNPNFRTRKRFRKLYEDYRFEFIYWKVRHANESVAGLATNSNVLSVRR